MSDILKNHDELGNVFVQVQDDLRQLRRSLVRVTVQSNGETVDIQALDTAIRRTECVIRRREEQYLNTVNKQVLILPGIEDIQKQKTQISKWTVMHKRFGIQLPDLRQRSGTSVSNCRETDRQAGMRTDRRDGMRNDRQEGVRTDRRDGVRTDRRDGLVLFQGSSAVIPVSISNLSFTILEGHHQPCAQTSVTASSTAVCRLLRDYAVPTARVHGTRLVELVQVGLCSERLISVLENREEVWELVQRPGQRYRGEGGVEAAATHIQSYWRCHVARASYLLHRRRRWAVGTIAISWLMHTQLGRVRGSLQESRRTHLENYRIRAQYLSANWKHIQSSRRTIIHIPSLGYSQSQRFSLKGFDILQNVQMGRLCDVRDDNVEVIYVSPVRLGDDLFQYYSHLIGLFQGAAVEPRDAAGPRVGTSTQAPMSKRFTILIPDALEDFPTHNMCLSSLLKYSPRTLRRIRHLIQGKQAYVVGGVTHVDDLAVADELEVPLLGPEPAVAQLYSTKSGGRRVFSSAGVAVPPGQWDVYSLQQLHEALARLMTNHILVRRWLFKMDSEMCGRGTAYCDVSHLRCFTWAQQVYSLRGPEMWRKAWAQESVLVKYLEEVPEWLARYARPVRPSCYPSWTCFLDTFLRHGGVVEAYPPSDSVTCLTVDLFLQPDGKVTMLSCGDQLHGPSDLETVGSSVPQNSVTPEDLYSVCLRVGRACLSRCITGHVSLDLATFLDPVTLDQQLWAIDLDLGYSNQLALTQLMLGTTGGSLDCRTSRLEVPLTSREANSVSSQLPTVASRYAVLGNRLLHTNLSMVHYSVFFQMCKAQGIGFDIKEKQGTVFALHDSFERHSLGMVTICEDLQGALMAYVRNLSVIHQEISTPNMQGETNFKDLIREIEGVLGLTVQNKAQPTTEEDKMAVSLPGLN
uniref:IQ motif containing H n=1 Tax=Esox lucius TaxID=8010 RepID=A0A3P8Z9U9_ESOLU